MISVVRDKDQRQKEIQLRDVDGDKDKERRLDTGAKVNFVFTRGSNICGTGQSGCEFQNDTYS